MGKKIVPRKKINVLEDTFKPIKDNAKDNGVSITTVKNIVEDNLNGLLDDQGYNDGYEVHQKDGYLLVLRPLLKYQSKLQPLLKYLL